MWLNLFAAAGVLFLVVWVWFIVHYMLNPHVKNADAEARVTGTCGDTMEIRLRFRKNRIVETSYWTSGCLYSLNCICAAADLAKGKTPEEVLDIDADTIQRSVGGLPKDHMHCAALAVSALRHAIDDYMRKPVGQLVEQNV